MSVSPVLCLYVYLHIFKSNVSNVRITKFDKVNCYMGVLFLLYYRGNECDEHMMLMYVECIPK